MQIKIDIPEEIQRIIPKFVEFLNNFDSKPQPQDSPDEILNAADVCRIFKIPKSKLYTMTMRTGKGTIPRFKIGRDLKFKRSELKKWFDAQRVNHDIQ